MKLRFRDVGAQRMMWEAEVREGIFFSTDLLAAIRKGRALASRDFEWEFDPDTGLGGIYVGFARKVGTIERVDEEERIVEIPSS